MVMLFNWLQGRYGDMNLWIQRMGEHPQHRNMSGLCTKASNKPMTYFFIELKEEKDNSFPSVI